MVPYNHGWGCRTTENHLLRTTTSQAVFLHTGSSIIGECGNAIIMYVSRMCMSVTISA